jgi:hypothetical protein
MNIEEHRWEMETERDSENEEGRKQGKKIN